MKIIQIIEKKLLLVDYELVPEFLYTKNWLFYQIKYCKTLHVFVNHVEYFDGNIQEIIMRNTAAGG